jgi:hypothetical protein
MVGVMGKRKLKIFTFLFIAFTLEKGTDLFSTSSRGWSERLLLDGFSP